MMARKKSLTVIPATDTTTETNSISFTKPEPKGQVTLVDAGDLDRLIDLLHNEAKAI